MGLVYTDCFKSSPDKHWDDTSSNSSSSSTHSSGDLLRCKRCHNHICKLQFLMSENFYGSTGPAYYVSRVINCDLLKPEVKTMRTGKYTIRSLTCKQCGVDMGWKYIHSDNFKEKYKEGNYVIELGFLEQAEG